MELWLKKKIPTKAILMVTHNIEEAVLMADRIVIMGKDPGIRRDDGCYVNMDDPTNPYF